MAELFGQIGVSGPPFVLAEDEVKLYASGKITLRLDEILHAFAGESS